MRKINLSAALFVLFVLVNLVFGEVPHIIPYQARITDASGNPITNPKQITYEIYTTPPDPLGDTPESPIWSETHTVNPNSEGIYNVMLGSVTPFNGILDFSKPYWLSIIIDSNELCRYQLGSSPYALNLSSLGANDGQILKWNSISAKWEPGEDISGVGENLQDVYRNGETITITPTDPGYIKIETEHHEGGLMVKGTGNIEYNLYSLLDLDGEFSDYMGSGAIHTKIIDNEDSPSKWAFGELCKSVKNPVFEYYGGATGVYMSSNNDTLAGCLGIWQKRVDSADTFAAVMGYVDLEHRELPDYFAGLFIGDVSVTGDLFLKQGIYDGYSKGTEGQVLTATGSGDVIWQDPPATGSGFHIKTNDEPWLIDSVRLVEGKNIKLTQFADSICIAFDESDGCPKVCVDTLAARVSNRIQITDSLFINKTVSIEGDFYNQEVKHSESYTVDPNLHFDFSLDGTCNLDIPDNGCGDEDYVEFGIEVGEMTGSISDIGVEVWIEHTYDADLIIKLISPSGTVVNLSSWHGGSGNNYGSTDNYTRFDDDASMSISDGSAPFEGSYSPDEPLSTFYDENPKGKWTLRVCDDSRYDSGVLRGFNLYINGSRISISWLLVGEAAVTYRNGSSVVVLTNYSAEATDVNGLKTKLTKATVAGVESEGITLGFAADSPSGSGNHWVSTTIVHHDDGTDMTDETVYYYKLWRMGSIEPNQENWSIVPMLIKE
ncbi:proprotein convertase P-domain-containing protein [bacterium]|nr:proprotein convertase P-domain-containing protein [bacterium]